MIGTPAAFRSQRQVQRSLPAKLHDHADFRAARRLVFVDGEHVFKGERLKVQAVAGVVVGRDRLRVAVDHDRLVVVFLERECRMAAAVIELDSLPDAVGAAAQDDDFALLRRRRFVFLVVGRVEIGSHALEFGRAGVDEFEDRLYAVFAAQFSHLLDASRALERPDCRRCRSSEIPCAWLCVTVRGDIFSARLDSANCGDRAL